MARTIIKEYCVCKECGFGYANVKNHFCYTVMPPIYKAAYHCPVCKKDGEVNENEVFVKEEEINVSTPDPVSMPQDEKVKRFTLNGDNDKGETIAVDTSQDTPFIKVPELSEEDKEKILKYIKENKDYMITSLEECSIEPLININDLIKCIKLMKFCGVNDIGALKDGLITKEEYDFMHQIFSKIEGDK